LVETSTLIFKDGTVYAGTTREKVRGGGEIVNKMIKGGKTKTPNLKRLARSSKKKKKVCDTNEGC